VETNKPNELNTNNSGILKQYYRIDEVADYFSISKPTVYRLISDGEIQVIKIRQCVRVSAQEIKRLEKHFKFDVFK